MNFNKKYLDRALELAIENVKTGRGGPFGAVIVKNDEIIAEGVNLVTKTNDPTAHAEVEAIRAACATVESFQLTDCVIYASCEPCPMCWSAIHWAHISAIYFAATKEDAATVGFDDSAIYQEITRPLNERMLTTKQVVHDQALEPFRRWGKAPDKIAY